MVWHVLHASVEAVWQVEECTYIHK